jgi:hypothetical protein
LCQKHNADFKNLQIIAALLFKNKKMKKEKKWENEKKHHRENICKSFI